jgi:uncharacterized membrane protein
MMSDIISLRKTVVIRAPLSVVFEFWSNFRNFTDFIWLIESVEVLDSTKSRWIVRAPLNKKVQFDSEIKENIHNYSIVWESHHFAVYSRGDIKFFERGMNTRVDLVFSYAIKEPRIHKLAKIVSRLGFPSLSFDEGLVKIKSEIENRFDQDTRCHNGTF